jgi:hypothetical protein
LEVIRDRLERLRRPDDVERRFPAEPLVIAVFTKRHTHVALDRHDECGGNRKEDSAQAKRSPREHFSQLGTMPCHHRPSLFRFMV